MKSARKLLVVLGCWEGDSQLTTPHGHTQKYPSKTNRPRWGRGITDAKMCGKIWRREGEYDRKVSKNHKHKHKNINITSQTTS